jgi:hypothetical protein
MSSAAMRRWLHGDAGDVVRIVPARRDRERAPLGLRDGLPRWRRRIDRRRTAALVRRWLLLGLALAVVVELIAAVAGVSGRALWLILPGAITIAGIAAGLRARVDPAQATLLLDRQLGLSERLTTALELTRADSASGPLAALVLGEADSAIDGSLAHSRASDPSAAREWLAGVVVALALAGALALGNGSSGAHPRRLARASGATPVAGKGAAAPAPARGTLRSRSSHAAVAQAGTGARARKLTGSTRPASAAHQAQPARSPTGQGRAPAEGARAGATTQSRNGSTSSAGASSHALAGAGRGAATSSATSTQTAAARGASVKTGATANTGASAKAGATAKTGATGLAGGAARAGSRTDSTSAAARPSAASAHAGAASPAASRGAGAVPGRAPGVGSRAPSRQAAGTSPLPIQSGYTASQQHHPFAPATGDSAGKGNGRPTQPELASSTAGAPAASFAFIPFADAGLPPSDAPLLLGYFGPFASLAGLAW